MATGGAATSSTATRDLGAQLREGRMASLRTPQRLNRATASARNTRRTSPSPRFRNARGSRSVSSDLSTMPIASTPQDDLETEAQNPVAEFNANRHAVRRYANPGASAPQLQALAESVRDEGDEEDQEAADELDASNDAIAEEAAQAEHVSFLARVKARLQATREDWTKKMLKKGKKEFERLMANAKMEGQAKYASAVDNGEGLEIVDTAGTAVSATHAVLSIFQDSFNEPTKEALLKAGFPLLKMSRPIDVAIIAGTNMQIFKWSFMVTVVIPFGVIFIVMSAITMCHQNPIICGATSPLLYLITLRQFLGI